MRLFTLCSYLITKESYDWRITRRKWGFKHQIYEEKNLKVSVANIWKHLGGFRRHARWLQNFASWRSPFRSQRLISQPSPCDFATKGWFRNLRNWPSAWCDWLPMTITSSFQLRIVHRLKRWIADFPRFETAYSMHEMSFKKCSKSCCHLEFFMLDFSLCFPSLHSWFAYDKGL